MMSDQRNNTSVQQAALFLKIARDNQNTISGQRAFLQSATMLFEAGQYADAQTQFQQFLNQYPDNFFAGEAALGLAASLDAQGKADLAAAAYQRVISNYPDPIVASYAKYSLAQTDERLGKSADALKLYEEIARSSSGGPLGSEAGLRAMELKSKQPAAAPAATTTALPILKP
jgi:TolA-binding protein